MNKHLEKYFIDTYPKIFKDMYGDPTKTCMAWGISTHDGWFFILDKLCATIQNRIDYRLEQIQKKYALSEEETKPIPQVVFQQVKEKFGALVIYYSGGDECIRHIVDYTEILSRSICETCGRFDEKVGRTEGWIQAMCEDCAIKQKRDIVIDKKKLALWKRVRKTPKTKKK